MATTKLTNGKTITTTIVGGKTIDSNGNPVPKSMIVTTTGNDGRTWAGDGKITTTPATTTTTPAGPPIPSGGGNSGNTGWKDVSRDASAGGTVVSPTPVRPTPNLKTPLVPNTNYLNNQTSYLNNLASSGDSGQQSWAKSQLNEINYLTGLINNGDSGQKSWATQELGKYITPSTSLATTSVTTPVTTQQTELQKVADLLQQYQQQATLLPPYEPYEMQEFKYTQPSYHSTADSSDSYFVPTLAAKNAWLENEKAKYDAGYKNYVSDLSGWQAGNTALKNQISDALSLLPFMGYMTAEQRSEADLQGAKALAEANSWENSPEYQELKKQELLANIAAKLHTANAPYSSGGSSNPKPTQNDYVSTFMQSASLYKTPANYKADLMRYKADIIGYIGASNWKVLYDDAEEKVKAGNKVNPNYVSGTASPIGSMLGK